MDNNKILVSIRCLVYNHEPFLRQCLDGFVMQKTNFRFEAIVHDDASTDGSAAIIREYAEKYPDIIKPIYETENRYSKHDGSLGRIINAACRGKYIAMCEGDDYWIDPLKLQKQVDILEHHKNVYLVYTGFDTVDESSNLINRPLYDDFMKKSKSGDIFRALLHGNFILTLTICYRKEVLVQYEKNNVKLDYSLFLQAASMGDVVYLPSKSGCYRLNRKGAMSTNLNRVDSLAWDAFKHFSWSFIYKDSIKHFSIKESCIIKILILSKALNKWLNKTDRFFISKLLSENKHLYFFLPISFFYGLYRFLIRKRIYRKPYFDNIKN